MVRAGEIRVIDDEKKPLGVMTAADALVLGMTNEKHTLYAEAADRRGPGYGIRISRAEFHGPHFFGNLRCAVP